MATQQPPRLLTNTTLFTTTMERTCFVKRHEYPQTPSSGDESEASWPGTSVSLTKTSRSCVQSTFDTIDSDISDNDAHNGVSSSVSPSINNFTKLATTTAVKQMQKQVNRPIFDAPQTQTSDKYDCKSEYDHEAVAGNDNQSIKSYSESVKNRNMQQRQLPNGKWVSLKWRRVKQSKKRLNTSLKTSISTNMNESSNININNIKIDNETQLTKKTAPILTPAPAPAIVAETPTKPDTITTAQLRYQDVGNGNGKVNIDTNSNINTIATPDRNESQSMNETLADKISPSVSTTAAIESAKVVTINAFKTTEAANTTHTIANKEKTSEINIERKIHTCDGIEQLEAIGRFNDLLPIIEPSDRYRINGHLSKLLDAAKEHGIKIDASGHEISLHELTTQLLNIGYRSNGKFNQYSKSRLDNYQFLMEYNSDNGPRMANIVLMDNPLLEYALRRDDFALFMDALMIYNLDIKSHVNVFDYNKYNYGNTIASENCDDRKETDIQNDEYKQEIEFKMHQSDSVERFEIMTPMHLVVGFGCLDILQKILHESGFANDFLDEQTCGCQDTPLMIAMKQVIAQRQQLWKVKVKIFGICQTQQKLRSQSQVESKSAKESITNSTATEKGNKLQEELNFTGEIWENLRARTQHRWEVFVDIFMSYQSSKGDINMVNREGYSALHYATMLPDSVSLSDTIEYEHIGNEFEYVSEKLKCILTAMLMLSKHYLNVDQTKFAIDLNLAGGSFDSTPLHIACLQKNVKIVELLIQHINDNDGVDFDVNKVDAFGHTSLMCGLMRDNENTNENNGTLIMNNISGILHLFLTSRFKLSIDFGLRDGRKNNLLMIAIGCDFIDGVNRLLQFLLNEKRMGMFDICRLYLTKRNTFEQNALMLACENGNVAIVNQIFYTMKQCGISEHCIENDRDSDGLNAWDWIPLYSAKGRALLKWKKENVNQITTTNGWY